MLWLCLRFTHLSLEIFTRSQAEKPNNALVIIEQHRVHCCNVVAKNLGIKVRSSWASTCALSPDTTAIERAPALEQDALQALARWAYQFTPAISIEPPDKLLLEIQGSLALFGELAILLHSIQQGVDAQGYSLATGLANTVKAAILMSYSKTPLSAYTSKQKLITEKFRPILNALPVSALNITDKLTAKLCRTGFESLHDVFSLPYAAAGKRYGKAFVVYLQQIQGQISDPQKPIQLPEHFSESLHFMQGISDSQALLFPLQRLLALLCAYLRIRQLHCSGFTCLLIQHSGQKSVLELDFSQAQNSLACFLSLLRIKLENYTIKSPIETLTLETCKLLQAEQASESLFSGFEFSLDPLASSQDAVQVLLDKLGARLDKSAVYGLGIQDSHIPEYAWQPRSVIAPSTKNKAQFKHKVHDIQRPVWLLKQALPIQQKQQQLYWHGKLELIQDPERIEGNWWQKAVQRDYFIASRADGIHCWVFQDRLTQRWYVQGLFG